MPHERFLATAITAGLCLAAAGRADAYELQRTPEGAPVRWESNEVVVDLGGLDAAPQAHGAVMVAARRALETWSAAGGPVLVDSADAGADAPVTASVRWAASPDDPGVSPDVLAETHLSFDMTTGAIRRAEIVVNGGRFRWAAGDDVACSQAFDLESTLAHEVGHALGLKHSEVLEATMFTRPAPCANDRRDLASDDVAAIEDLYAAPPAASADEAAMGGCSAAGSNGLSGAVTVLLVVAAAILARSRAFLRR